MDQLFEDKSIESKGIRIPLAERMRPKLLKDVVGQQHLIGEDKVIYKFVKNRKIPSIIFWGPPGVGKTTIANVIANELDFIFKSLSAVDSGVKDLRQVISLAEQKMRNGKQTILFIDEIHRFSKSQQDALLHAVENGTVILIGATTENPSFEVNSALLSRCNVYKLEELSNEDILDVIHHAIENDVILKGYNFTFEDEQYIVHLSGGDARTALNLIEASIIFSNDDNAIVVSREMLEKIISQKILHYDKKGENHYDVISAFIKSMRGSSPDAALFWLARMIESGEDPKFIARRMVIFASEDIGNADSNALNVAISVFRACEIIGMPECVINLAHGVTYLASAPKSNASYLAIMQAQTDIRSGIDTTVPLKLRNAPTKLMKDENYGKDYKYPHDFDNHFVDENYFPDSIEAKKYYNPTENGLEKRIKERLEFFWSKLS